MRVMIIVAYDGTNYAGWQIQKGQVTIEQKLNEALGELLQEEINVIGASRTDAGVHSLGSVAVFDTDTKIAPEKISYAANTYLPPDIVIQESFEVDEDFHPRKCDSEKTYEYRILNRRMPLPQRAKDTYHYRYPLDIDKMRAAASYLIGPHDFKSFCSTHAQVKDTIRTIYSISILKEEDIISIRVCGAGFLYNMVRIIAGTLIEVGAGRMEPQNVGEILKKCDRKYAGPTAPAKGLTLISIEFL